MHGEWHFQVRGAKTDFLLTADEIAGANATGERLCICVLKGRTDLLKNPTGLFLSFFLPWDCLL